MFRLFLFSLFFFSSIFNACAQGENNIWTFGDLVALDFNSGTPLLGTSSMIAHEGCATTCSATGQLLFYSNGNTVWDRNGNIMPNGDGILSNYGPLGLTASSTQGVAIVPFFNDTSKYYLFVLEALEGTSANNQTKLRYNVIDMSLNNGLGDVVPTQKNIMLDTVGSEKMVVARGDGCYSWLIVHCGYTNEFHAWKIDASGISPDKVVSSSGFGELYASSGEMKISHDFKKIAVSAPVENYLELHDFDNTTGVVSNAIVIDSEVVPEGAQIQYGLEFSPDNSKLYYSFYSNIGVRQLNLSLLPNVSAVQASETVIANTGIYMGMKIGPDDKLYIAAPGTGLARISNPNNYGSGTGFIANAIYAPNTHWGMGSNVIANRSDTTTSSFDTSLCSATPVQYNAVAGYASYLWSNGGTGPQIIFNNTDSATLVATNGCSVLLDTVRVIFTGMDTVVSIHYDTVCTLAPVNTILSTPAGYDLYQWNTGELTNNITATATGVYYCVAANGCSIFIDTFIILPLPISNLEYLHDTNVCFSPSVELAGADSANAWLWSNGSTSPNSGALPTAQNAWLQSSFFNSCTLRTDSFHINNIDFTPQLADSAAICEGEQLVLNTGLGNEYSFLWSTGDTTPTISISTPALYSVTISKLNCSKSDSILVSPRNFSLNLGDDTNFCAGEEWTLYANLNNAHFHWQDGSSDSTLIVKESGVYALVATYGDCMATDTITITFSDCDHCILTPNAFSPNADGSNDNFEITALCPLASYNIKIFNRWGQLVFESKNINDSWDGYFGMQPAESGIYYYKIRVLYQFPEGKEEIKTGDITLLR